MQKSLFYIFAALLLSSCGLFGTDPEKQEGAGSAPVFDVHEIVTDICGGSYKFRVSCKGKWFIYVKDGSWYQGEEVNYVFKLPYYFDQYHTGDAEYTLPISAGIEGSVSTIVVSNEYGRDELTFYRRSAGCTLFTVASGRRVLFSPGDLQYNPGSGLWRFAPGQLDLIREGNEDRSLTDHWIDHFIWGSGNAPMEIYERQDAFYEWGDNPIGDYPAGTWRTPGLLEWEYLFQKRPFADRLKLEADYMGVRAMVILPDSCIPPAEAHFSDAGKRQFSEAEWRALESVGAIALPYGNYSFFAEYQDSCVSLGGNTYRDGDYYWTSTGISSEKAYMMEMAFDRFESDKLMSGNVRLVKDEE